MTTVKDNYDEWTEAAFEYVRDSLRTNTRVGIAGEMGVRAIEVGIPDLELLARHPESLPQVWVAPRVDRLSRSAGYIVHRLQLEVHVLTSTARSTSASVADGQKRHRQLVGRVYNETLELRDGGKAAGHWQTMDPDGDLAHEGGTVNDHAILHTVLPVAFTRDRPWIQGA